MNQPFRHPRRSFLKGIAAGSAGLLLDSQYPVSADPAPSVRNPYAAVNWTTTKQVGSGSHIHCRAQRELESMHGRGMRHLAISNYYPSAPCTIDERTHQYWCEQNFVTRKGEGYTGQTVHWNEILTHPETGWADELPEELQKTLPFKVGEPIFMEVPDDVIICPNAEHHSATDANGHFNSLGSTFSSGNFDVRNKYKTVDHGYAMGLGIPWKEAFKRILDQLQFADGGGITINHPVWSKQKFEETVEMLDFDPRVLGIEIWNHTCERINNKGWALELWDKLLTTGRRCWGFSVSDHVHQSGPDFLGYNVLLIDAGTPAPQLPQACLKAYRNGQFYCVLQGDVRFESIQLIGDSLQVKTNLPCAMRAISATGVVSEQSGTHLEWQLPTEQKERARLQYLRLEADQLQGKDRLFSQPLFLA